MSPRSTSRFYKFTLKYFLPLSLYTCTLWEVANLSCTYSIVNSRSLHLFRLDFFILSFISFTLHPAHSRVGRGNLVLRHSVLYCPPNSGGIACWVTELNAALCLGIKAKKLKYFISCSGHRINNVSCLLLCSCATTGL